MRTQSSMGLGEKCLKAQHCGQSNVVYSPIDARAMSAPTSKLPEDREFVVDSGASMHMLCKKDLSSDEMDTLRRSRNPTTVVTPSGEVQTNEEAQVYVHDLDLFVTVKITRGHASSSVTWKGSAKKMEIPTSGPALKHHGWPKMVRNSYAKRKICTSCCSWIVVLVPARLLHRHRKTH